MRYPPPAVANLPTAMGVETWSGRVLDGRQPGCNTVAIRPETTLFTPSIRLALPDG